MNIIMFLVTAKLICNLDPFVFWVIVRSCVLYWLSGNVWNPEVQNSELVLSDHIFFDTELSMLLIVLDRHFIYGFNLVQFTYIDSPNVGGTCSIHWLVNTLVCWCFMEWCSFIWEYCCLLVIVLGEISLIILLFVNLRKMT